MYNLTDTQKELLRSIVTEIRDGSMPEEFYVFWDVEGDAYLHWDGCDGFRKYDGMTRARLDSLQAEHLIRCQIEYSVSHSTFGGSTRENRHESSRVVSITAKGYEAVENKFDAPDTSFVRHLTPLADISQLDPELKPAAYRFLVPDQLTLSSGIQPCALLV